MPHLPFSGVSAGHCPMLWQRALVRTLWLPLFLACVPACDLRVYVFMQLQLVLSGRRASQIGQQLSILPPAARYVGKEDQRQGRQANDIGRVVVTCAFSCCVRRCGRSRRCVAQCGQQCYNECQTDASGAASKVRTVHCALRRWPTLPLPRVSAPHAMRVLGGTSSS